LRKTPALLPFLNDWRAQSASIDAAEGVLHMNALKRFLKDESGATAIEYGLIAALIAVVIIGTVGALGTRIDGAFQQIRDALPTGG
jgi:pilus assembly protein Flp/PilA